MDKSIGRLYSEPSGKSFDKSGKNERKYAQLQMAKRKKMVSEFNDSIYAYFQCFFKCLYIYYKYDI